MHKKLISSLLISGVFDWQSALQVSYEGTSYQYLPFQSEMPHSSWVRNINLGYSILGAKQRKMIVGALCQSFLSLFFWLRIIHYFCSVFFNLEQFLNLSLSLMTLISPPLAHVVCGILVPQPGIEPLPLTVETQSLNHWTTREIPLQYLDLLKSFVFSLVSLNCLISPEYKDKFPFCQYREEMA